MCLIEGRYCAATLIDYYIRGRIVIDIPKYDLDVRWGVCRRRKFLFEASYSTLQICDGCVDILDGGVDIGYLLY